MSVGSYSTSPARPVSAGRNENFWRPSRGFEVVCREFTTGMAMKANGEPQDRFWTALRELMHERRVCGDLVLRRPESVATLRRQKVSDFQIAQHIYGRRGKGPFIDADGRIRHDLIDQEEKEPGSVVPADWVHEAEIERLRDQHIAIGEAAQPNGSATKGPPTIEGMLREGASIEQNPQGVPGHRRAGAQGSGRHSISGFPSAPKSRPIDPKARAAAWQNTASGEWKNSMSSRPPRLVFPPHRKTPTQSPAPRKRPILSRLSDERLAFAILPRSRRAAEPG